MKLQVILASFCVCCASWACMWDSDTLAMEAKGFPDVVKVISGRFERNPPLYFELRLKRVSEELKTQPTDLALYDDAGVSAARLGHNDEAIAWMAKKLKALEAAKAKGVANTDHWYRYHANLGTFLIHKWLHDGAKPGEIKEAQSARDHIAQAIVINPDAHFGREYMQLAAMDGIIAVISGKAKQFDLFKFVEKRTSKEKVQGICGLIVLGAGWESVDMFDALAYALSMDSQASLAYLSGLRRNELLDDGKKPLKGTAEEMRKNGSEMMGAMIYDSAKPGIEREFKMLREESKRYESLRTAYMMERLKAGRHPDTDSTFWNEWKEPPAPVLRDWKSVSNYPYGPLGGGIAIWIVLMAWALRRRAKKRREMASASG